MKRLIISILIAGNFFQLSAQTVLFPDPVINKLPAVSFIAPSNGTAFTAPASFSLNAIASDEDGKIVKVEFFNGTTLLGSTSASPYSYNWLNVPEGIYRVSAKATDNLGESSMSFVTLIVTMNTVNQLPAVTLLTPLSNITINAPASITITADATDADGAISRVEFYNGALLLGVDTTLPYNYIWSGVGAGVYRITAKAIDNEGASKLSAAAVITLASVITDVCAVTPLYIENGGYVGGSKVKSSNGRYECKAWPYSGWCNGSAWAYAPGEGAYWMDAWTYINSCSNTANKQDRKTTVLEDLIIIPNPVLSAATVRFVLNEPDHVSLKLYDKYSQYIQTIAEDDFVAGSYNFSLNLDGVPKDTYLLKIVTGIDSKVVRIEKSY